MECTDHGKRIWECNRMRPEGTAPEQEPMHPDDFSALLAWITAKRYHEMVLGKTHAEKAVYYRLLG